MTYSNPLNRTIRFSKIFLLITFSSLFCSLLACSDDSNNQESQVEICNDSIDNDGDGFIDCEDSNCSTSTSCEEICNDGIDNDGDGFIDCEDLECEAFIDCLIERCIDGVDNDGDGLIDCDDPDCNANINCT